MNKLIKGLYRTLSKAVQREFDSKTFKDNDEKINWLMNASK